MTDPVTPEDLARQITGEVKETYKALDKKTEDLAQVIDEIRRGVESKADTSDLEGRMKAIHAEIEKLGRHADELDKRMQRPRGGAEEEPQTAGQKVAAADAIKHLASGSARTAQIEVKEITSLPTSTPRSPLYSVEKVPGIIREPDRPLMVRDLLPVGPTNAMVIEYDRETAFTNAAATVAEGTLKPESNITYEAADARVVTIAHWIRASKQVLDDVRMLASDIDDRLRMGLMQVEENEILLGPGGANRILGLVPQATAYDGTGIPAGATMVDVVRWAKLQVRRSFYPASGIVINPAAWAQIEMMKDTQGAYLYSAVTTGAERRLWGMRVVESDALPEDAFLLGAFNIAAKIWDRETANVQVSTEDRDNFVTNRVTIRGEERVGLTVYRPASFVYGTFTAAP